MAQSLQLLTPQMKTTEAVYANRMTSDLYDACRLIRDFFDRAKFKKFEPDSKLLKMVQRVGTDYKEESQAKASTSKDTENEARKIRHEVGVFKRKTTKEVASQLKQIDRQLMEVESNVTSLKNQKRKLLENQQAVIDRQHENSSCHRSMVLLVSFVDQVKDCVNIFQPPFVLYKLKIVLYTLVIKLKVN